MDVVAADRPVASEQVEGRQAERIGPTVLTALTLQVLLQKLLNHLLHQAARIQKQSAKTWPTFPNLKCHQRHCGAGGLAKPTKGGNLGTKAGNIRQVTYFLSCC